MSTLMSRDLNIERSSTRLHAPPGGKSSISFGSDEPVKKPVVVPAELQNVVPVVTAPVVPDTVPVTEVLSVFSVPATVTVSPMKAAAPVSLMSSLISQEVTTPMTAAPLTARRGHPSYSSIFNNQNEAPSAPVTARRGHPNDSSMRGIINQDEGATAPVRRVRQAPGGNSSIILG